MNMLLNKNLKNIFGAVVVAVALAFVPGLAHAQNLVVDFEADPLFSEANFLPGNEVVRTVDVTNNTEVSKNVVTEAVNAHDNDGLGDELQLVIKEGETVLYDDTLGDFLREGIVPLSLLGAGESTIYSFGVTFDIDAGNDTQGGDLGFDLCIGFEGGEMTCGDTVVGNENGGGDNNNDENDEEENNGVGGDPGGGTTGGGGSSGGGGGGIVDTTSLVVFNEDALNSDPTDGTALITWESNLLSTSQVIYGPASGGPYSLNLTVLPYFGYPMGTVEDPLKTTNHSVLLTGLTPGETYKFRVVSRASPPTVGFEYEFTFNNNGNVAVGPTSTGGGNSGNGGNNGSNSGGSGGGSLADGGTSSSGASGGGSDTNESAGGSNQISTGGDLSNNDSGSEDDSGEELENPNVQNLAVSIFGVPETFNELLLCLAISLIVLIVIFFVWLFWKNRYKDDPLYMNNLNKNRSLFFIVAIFIAAVIMFFLHRCAILPLTIALLIFIVIYVSELVSNR